MDIRTRADLLNDRSRLITRIAEPDDTKILTLLDTADRSDPCEMPDPLIQALVDKLPKPNAVWSIDDRAKWLKAVAMAFNLVYRLGEREDLKESPSVFKSVG
jgi:hypothetical protein